MAGQLGYGITLSAGATAAAGTATIPMGGLTEIPFPAISRDAVEVTAHDSPSGFREYIAGLKQIGELQLSLNLIPGNATHDHIRLMQDVAMNVQADFFFELTYAQMAGTPKVTFRAFVLGFEGDGPVDAPLTGTLTLRPVSVPAWTGV